MLELVRSMALTPRIMLIDEPAAGLAPSVFRAVYDKISYLRSLGATVLLVDQNIRKAFEVSDYIYVLQNGTNFAEGKSSELSAEGIIKNWLLGA